MSPTPKCTGSVLFAIIALLVAIPAQAEDAWMALASPDNALDFRFARGTTPTLHMTAVAWGPKWAWVGLSARQKLAGDPLSVRTNAVVNKAAGESVEVGLTVRKSGPRQVQFVYDLKAAKDVPLTMLVASLGADKAKARGTVTLTHVDGKQETLKMPLGLASKPATSRVEFALENGARLVAAIDPPRALGVDGDIRIMLAGELLKAPGNTTTVTIDFPGDVALTATEADLAQFSKPIAGPDWFAFNPGNDIAPTAISMDDWLEKPAGKRGGVRMVKDRFEFEDGTPVRFWGTNLSYGSGCAPQKKDADFMAAKYARFGINAVRLHKFTYPRNAMGIGDLDDPRTMEPAGMDRLDYFSAKLKERGVYFGWSHTFGYLVRPGQRDKLRAYDEIAANLKGNTYGLINLAEDVQDLLIETCVNLLKHKNPYTGLTYAQDPALSFIELQNEDDIFFFTNEKAFNACPTYKKYFIERFSDWLKAKYGSEEALKKAWGDALKSGENLAARNIIPVANPWFFGDQNLPKQTGGARQRLLDTSAHYHELQNAFYARYVKAIRDAGYKGPICGSPWQAPSMQPHYYNLKSDYLVGYIDRHNYFGGKLGDTMLSRPGSGYFSSGMQQVADRPFGLSEWIHVYPSLYSAEGPVIVAAYGLGLQGWDCSYQFQSHAGTRMFSERAGWQPWGVWDADTPTQLGQFPTLARMVLRGDVKEGAIISRRCVSGDELAGCNFSFTDKVAQEGDIKSFSGSTPQEALAAGRVVVEFTDKPQPSTFPDMAGFKKGSVIVANNGQLSWDTAGQGHIAINTAGTRGFVGFANGKRIELGDVTITPQCDYASILISATEKNQDLKSAKSAIVTAVARSSNSGFKIFSPDGRVLDNGKGPILLEPVKAEIAITGSTVAEVEILNQDGKSTGEKLPLVNGRFTIDTAREKTLYYRINFSR